MKKILAYTLAFLSTFLVSCQEDNVLVQQEHEGKVKVSLDFVTPEPVAMTKALSETVDLETNGLWVIVYESGYRCEIVQAENLTEVESGKYTCSLTLSVTENKRNLHFISKAGFKAEDAPYEETRLGSLTSEGGVDAYWQIRTLPNIPYDVNELKANLVGSTGTITLIRNFAKVTMKNSATNFELISFKVFNTPNKGYIAPYISSGSKSGFVSNYDALEYKGSGTPYVNGALDVYPGRMPNDCTLNGYTSADAGTESTLPGSFVTWNSASPDNVAQYFYERPVPTENPAFIIVAGKFNGSSKYSYYKINLRDKDDDYYALLRGFRFKVNILEVIAEGYPTVQQAYNSAGSGDISTSLEYSSIKNISDGVCRLFVNATSFTAIKAGTIEVKYKFIPDVKYNPTTVKNTVLYNFDATTNTGVGITVKNPVDGIQPSIAKNSSDEWDYTVGTTDTEGWTTITVNTNAPNNLYKEQIINIRGRGNDGTNTTVLQRDVHIIVRPTLTLYAEMAEGYSTVDFGKGKDVKLNFWMEDELPESIFPLNVKIEAGKLSLTPAPGEQLPVESGQSASTSDPKPAFYFVKTVKWDDYNAITAIDKEITVGGSTLTRKMRKFACNFKTNTAESATSIYVSHELFNTASTGFTNATALTLSPVTPANWSATATEEPYVGQTFNATIVASVPAGTTITGTTTVGGSSSNVTASISGTILTITRTGMSYSSSGFQDLAVSTTLSTGSFSFTPKVVVWTKPAVTSPSATNTLSNDAYIMITPKEWNSGTYFIYENNSNQPKLGNSSTDNFNYVWQIKDWNTSSKTGKLMNYATGRYLESTSSNNVSSTSTTSTATKYGTFEVSYTDSYWQIKNTGTANAYMNRHGGGSSTNVGYYNVAGSDAGSRWVIYTCEVNPAVRPTE